MGRRGNSKWVINPGSISNRDDLIFEITCGVYLAATITIKPKRVAGTSNLGLVELAGIEPATS